MVKTRPDDASPLFTALWIEWLAQFAVIEGIALARRRPQDTLSDHVWAWFGVPKHPAPKRSERIRRVILLGFMAWLGAHFLTGDEV